VRTLPLPLPATTLLLQLTTLPFSRPPPPPPAAPPPSPSLPVLLPFVSDAATLPLPPAPSLDSRLTPPTSEAMSPTDGVRRLSTAGLRAIEAIAWVAASFISSLMQRARQSRAPRKMWGKTQTLLIWLGKSLFHWGLGLDVWGVFGGG